MADLNELIAKTTDMTDAFYTAELTDQYIVGEWSSHGMIDEAKVLEIRVFNKKREIKLFREDIGERFRLRELTDAGDHYDECQLLDIDTKKTVGLEFVTTGGGSYKVPASIAEMKIPMIRIRYYLRQDSRSGQTYIYDWRCVDFEDYGKEKVDG